VNSKKKCCFCKEYFPPEEMKKYGVSWFCTDDHAAKYAIARAEKARKSKLEADERKKKANAEEFQKIKARVGPKGGWEKGPQNAVNRFINARDKGKPCISCGCTMIFGVGNLTKGAIANAGHFRSRGSAPHLKFDTRNINSQCVSCNSWKSSNRAGYEAGIVKRFGQERLDALISDQSTKNYTKDDFKRITRIFNRRTKHYKKLPQDSSRFVCKIPPEIQQSLPL